MGLIEIPSGATIHYGLIDGSRDRPCLVFLHEGLGCIQMWKDFPHRLCSRLGCQGLLYDRSGYGESSPELHKRGISYLHDAALKELPEVISNLIPSRDYVLVGHSDGASIALIHGAGEPSLLRGIITEAAHVCVEDETVFGIRDAVGKYGKDGPRGLQKYHGDRAAEVFRAWSETWLSDWFRVWSIERLLPAIRCPVLAIQGRLDTYGTEKQVVSITSKVSGWVESFLIPDCGHAPHLEQPERVLDSMAGFVDGLILDRLR